MASYNFKTQQQLQVGMTTILNLALDNTMEILLKELQRIIERDVYDAYEPTMYIRTNQFLESWYNLPAVTRGNYAYAILQHDESMLIKNDFFNQHIQSGIADIINSGEGYMLEDSLNPVGARPYWDNFLSYVELNLYTIFQQECTKLGLKIT